MASNLTYIEMRYVKVEKLMNETLFLHENIIVMRVVYPKFFCRRLVGQHIEE